MAYMNTSATASVGMMDRLTGAFALVKRTLHRRRVYMTTVRELMALSNRELADLGIHRADIARIAMEAACGE